MTVTDPATPSTKPPRAAGATAQATPKATSTTGPKTKSANVVKTTKTVEATKTVKATKPVKATKVAAPVDASAGTRPGLPARDKPASGGRQESLEIARRVVELAEDKKAADIVLLDLGELTTLADAFVICSGGSERQLDAIADGVVSGLREQGVRPIGREGVAASHWVLLDYGGVIVHIFTPPERDFYELEKHWSEARTVLRVQ